MAVSMLHKTITPCFKATTNSVTTSITPGPPVHRSDDHHGPSFYRPRLVSPLTLHSHQSLLPRLHEISAVRSPHAVAQMRCYHGDIKMPESMFDYSRQTARSPTTVTRETVARSQTFNYAMTGSLTAATLYGAKVIVDTLLGSWSMSKRAAALATVEVPLTDIPMGTTAVVKWRGKPLFVRHRTAEEVAVERSVDISILRDPQRDEDRSQRPEWLVVVGICTHLGCVPISNLGEWGGWYCPCHGSHYDVSGRIRKGPAPLNLEVPEHSYIDDNTLLVGGGS